MREPIIEITGIAAALPLANVNTDTIIPAAWLRSPTLDLAQGLFAGWRYTEAGAENTEFVLNREPYRRASILVAGSNFGCGSSREAAIWALLRFGIRCVLAPSFADIFRENAFRNGLIAGVIEPATLPGIVAAIMQASGPAPFRVGLEPAVLKGPAGLVLAFEIPESRRQALIQGEDEIVATLRHRGEIDGFRVRDEKKRRWIYELPGQDAR